MILESTRNFPRNGRGRRRPWVRQTNRNINSERKLQPPMCSQRSSLRMGKCGSVSRIDCDFRVEACILDVIIGMAHIRIGLGEKRSTSVRRSFRLV